MKKKSKNCKALRRAPLKIVETILIISIIYIVHYYKFDLNFLLSSNKRFEGAILNFKSYNVYFPYLKALCDKAIALKDSQ